MDELKFKSHAEKEFWEKVYLAALTDSYGGDPMVAADAAVKARRARMSNLASKVRAA